MDLEKLSYSDLKLLYQDLEKDIEDLNKKSKHFFGLELVLIEYNSNTNNFSYQTGMFLSDKKEIMFKDNDYLNGLDKSSFSFTFIGYKKQSEETQEIYKAESSDQIIFNLDTIKYIHEVNIDYLVHLINEYNKIGSIQFEILVELDSIKESLFEKSNKVNSKESIEYYKKNKQIKNMFDEISKNNKDLGITKILGLIADKTNDSLENVSRLYYYKPKRK